MTELEQAAGRAIAARRRRANHTQESLAEACELHPTYISQLERGLKSPTLRVLFRLAGAMGIAPTTLVKGIEQELTRHGSTTSASKKLGVARKVSAR